MREIWLRFIACFTIGLLAFSVYFLVSLPLLLQLFHPGMYLEHTYDLEDGSYGPLILAFAVCFLSGGFFFSLLFVKPIYQILLSINRLSRGECLDRAGSTTGETN